MSLRHSKHAGTGQWLSAPVPYAQPKFDHQPTKQSKLVAMCQRSGKGSRHSQHDPSSTLWDTSIDTNWHRSHSIEEREPTYLLSLNAHNHAVDSMWHSKMRPESLNEPGTSPCREPVFAVRKHQPLNVVNSVVDQRHPPCIACS